MKKILVILLMTLLLISCQKTSSNNNLNNNNVNNDNNTEKPPVVVEEEPEYSKFDGHLLEEDETEDKRIFAVMFDNSKAARWQAGLSKASIVYEIRVESNITRYLGIFTTNEDVTVGPVRSARPYFVQTVAEYGATYAHFGGSTEGMDKISQLNISSINGLTHDGTVYYRTSHKIAPHNAYTSLHTLNERANDFDYPSTNTFNGFSFYPTAQSLGGNPATQVTIDYGSNPTRYEYDESTQLYHRYKDSILHLDETTEEPLEVSNIIIQHVSTAIAPNNVHKILGNVGNGTGYLVSHGEVIEITWSKDSETASTIFLDMDGNPITLNAGQTWIQWIEESAFIEFE